MTTNKVEITLSYKAVTHLLEREYKATRINLFIKEIPEGFFEGSLIFATEKEQYRYLDTMVTKRDDLNKEYDVFISDNEGKNLPLILRLGNGMRLNEFAILYHKSSIHINEFKDVVFAQAEGAPSYHSIKPDEQVAIFMKYVDFFSDIFEKLVKG